MSSRTPGGVWTGPRKGSKRKKINTIDPYHPNRADPKKEKGNPIKDMAKEAEHIPQSLRAIMEWQSESAAKKAKSQKEKKQANKSRPAPKTSIFLGDGNFDESSDSDDDFDEAEADILGDDSHQSTNQTQSTNQNQSTKTQSTNQNQSTKTQSTKTQSTKPQSTNQSQSTNQNSSSKNQSTNTQSTNNQKQKRKFDEISTKPGKDGSGKGKGKEMKGKGKEKEKGKGKGKEEEKEQEKEKKVQEFWELEDNVKFGERVDRPPTITVRPRKALKHDIQNDAKKIAIERSREKAILAYAASKKRKATNSGNKFFL